MPHTYLTNLKSILGRKSEKYQAGMQQNLCNPSKTGVACTIPKSSRFSTFDRTGPGPGEYTVDSGRSMSRLLSARYRSSNKFTGKSKLRLKETFVNTLEHSTFGHPHKYSKNLWFEEFDRSFMNKEGPGPSYYQPNESAQSIHKNGPKHKFSTTSRFMLIKDKSRSFKRKSASKWFLIQFSH